MQENDDEINPGNVCAYFDRGFGAADFVSEPGFGAVGEGSLGARKNLLTPRTSPDGKTVEFDFVDLAGGNENGHMYHALFTIVDANHHLEDWSFMMPGDKPMRAHFDLQKAK
jgi:hypothetical protein